VPAFQDFLGCTCGSVLNRLITHQGWRGTKRDGVFHSLSMRPFKSAPSSARAFRFLGEQRLEHSPTFHYPLSNQNRRGGLQRVTRPSELASSTALVVLSEVRGDHSQESPNTPSVLACVAGSRAGVVRDRGAHRSSVRVVLASFSCFFQRT